MTHHNNPYIDDAYLTVAQENDENIKAILEWRRSRGSFSSPFQKQHLCNLLEYRKKYRSDDAFPVWKLKDPPQGEPNFHWETLLELEEWVSDWDEKPEFEMVLMTGREYGNLNHMEW